MRGSIRGVAAISLAACGADVETAAPFPPEVSSYDRPGPRPRSDRCGEGTAVAPPCAEGYSWDDQRCMCTPAPPRCLVMGQCVEAHRWDEASCSCVPDEGAPIGTTCGAVVCAPGTECCNASCGICTAPGGVCIQQYCSYIWQKGH